MTALVLVRVGSVDRTTSDTLLAALVRAGATTDGAAAQWATCAATGRSRPFSLVGGFTDTDAALAFVADPSVRHAIATSDALAAPSIRVFTEVGRDPITPRRRSGWLRGVLDAAASPGGIPPGRTRPEPARHTTK